MSGIRSGRGRAAAWRQIWAWPLHSRRRALSTLILGAVGLALIGRLATMATSDNQQPTPAAAGTSTTATVTASTAPGSSSPTSGTSPVSSSSVPPVTPAGGPAAPPAALQASAWFVRAFTHPTGGASITPAMWRAGLEPYTRPELLDQLATASPENAPALTGTGQPTVVSVLDTMVVLTWPTDARVLTLTVLRVDGVWKVSAVTTP